MTLRLGPKTRALLRKHGLKPARGIYLKGMGLSLHDPPYDEDWDQDEDDPR